MFHWSEMLTHCLLLVVVRISSIIVPCAVGISPNMTRTFSTWCNWAKPQIRRMTNLALFGERYCAQISHCCSTASLYLCTIVDLRRSTPQRQREGAAQDRRGQIFRRNLCHCNVVTHLFGRRYGSPIESLFEKKAKVASIDPLVALEG
jgi:hypothetical protein